MYIFECANKGVAAGSARGEEETKLRTREAEPERIAIEMCTDKLQRLFMWYCSISDNSNTNKMPMSKFMTFLKDSGIISGSPDVSGKPGMQSVHRGSTTECY